MKKIINILLFLAIIFVVGTISSADDRAWAQGSLPVSVEVETYSLMRPEGPALLCVVWFQPDEGFYAYGHKPGPTGQPTNLLLRVDPDSVRATIFYPQGKLKKDSFDPSLEIEAYQGRTPVFALLENILPGEAVRVEGELRMLLCSDTSCWPAALEVKQGSDALDLLALPMAEDQAWWPVFESAEPDAGESAAPLPLSVAPGGAAEAEATPAAALEIEPRYFQPALEVRGLGKAALFGFLAGLILNVMPCVLPVVSLKLSALIAAAGVLEERRRAKLFREHNLLFALGILLYFIFLALLLALAGMAWGELFQSATVLMVLAVLVFALGLSLFGVYTLPVVDLKAGGSESRLQPLFTGVLATLMATPCSGPLLGGVLGWALLQPTAVVAMVFACIGLGMASPYLLLALRPGLVRYFPKPGAWTGYMEQFVGFVLMATVVYLLSILPASELIGMLILLLATGFAAWMWGGWTNLSQPLGKRLGIRAAALILIALTAFVVFRPSVEETHWRPLTADALNAALGKEPLMVEFTADWCPNCKVLEKTTLTPDNLARWEQGYGLRMLRADLTRKNPFAEDLLKKLGSQSIPVVALFPPGEDSKRPLVLRDLFTGGHMDEALVEAMGQVR